MAADSLANEQTLRRELELAADFQRAVLPAPLSLPYLTMSVTYDPHLLVSGDVYHLLLNREGELGVFVGDATGHGVSAALLTMMVMLGLDGIRRNLPTDETLRRLNTMLSARRTGLGVTGVFFRITPAGGLTVTHAGHPPLILIPTDGSPLRVFEKGGCPLGMFGEEPVPYEEETWQLSPGDKLFACTDAAIEWPDPEGMMFGAHNLQSCLDRHRGATPDALAAACIDTLKTHGRGRDAGDDLTIIVIEYTGSRANQTA